MFAFELELDDSKLYDDSGREIFNEMIGYTDKELKALFSHRGRLCPAEVLDAIVPFCLNGKYV